MFDYHPSHQSTLWAVFHPDNFSQSTKTIKVDLFYDLHSDLNNMNLSGFCINQAHDKLEEGRKQVETQDTVQLAKEVRFLLEY